jgi:hypothetical protein
LCTHVDARAFVQVLCATRSYSAKKQFDNQKQLEGIDVEASQIIFYVYEYASGDTGTLFSREKRSWRLNLAVAADVK